jgi:hypothetical protein
VVAGLTRLIFARFSGKTTPLPGNRSIRGPHKTGFARSMLASAGRIAGMPFVIKPAAIYSALFPSAISSAIKKRPVLALGGTDEFEALQDRVNRL